MDADKKPKQLNAPFVKTAMKYAGRAHAWAYRRSGGKIGGTWRVGAGAKKPVPTLLLEHKGRKSGKLFASPLVYITEGENVIVVAPGANGELGPQDLDLPEGDAVLCQLEIPLRRAVRAVVATPEEKERLWPKLVDAYADFDAYKAWTDRDIPVIILKPR